MKNLFYDLPNEIINVIYSYDSTYKEKFNIVLKELETYPTYEKHCGTMNRIWFSCIKYIKKIKYVNYTNYINISLKDAYYKTYYDTQQKFDEYLMEYIQNC